MSDLDKKVKSATKWSVISEITGKLVSPITSMVLARLLTPEAFGVVTTIAMIITFAEIFTDAGFQKYLVQHEFYDEKDRDESTNVAFWSNLLLSLFIWLLIIVFSSPLAAIVGNPGLGLVLVIACVSIPLEAFSSIQMALFKRDFDFKTLTKVRIVATFIPLLVTVPLAYWMRSYWALVIGTIFVNIVNAVLLTVFSKWKPRLYYSFAKLIEMFSFTAWSMIESVSIWLTGYVDIFIVGTMLSQYYLGLYKTSSALVGQIMGIVISVTTPILFSALSRLQNDEIEFQRLFYRFQKVVALLIVPIGTAIFLFQNTVTMIILGSQWIEAAGFVGLWGLTNTITIVLSHYSSEIYRAKGRPKLSVLAQVLHIIVLWPVVLYFVQFGFETLYIARSLVRFELIAVNLCIVGLIVKMPVGKMFTNIAPSFVGAVSMFLILLLPATDAMFVNVLYAVLAIIIYVAVVMAFREERNIILNLPQLLKRQ